MICQRCSAPIGDGSVFCSKCGLNLTVGAVATVTPPDIGVTPTAPPVPPGEILRRLAAALAPRYDVQRQIGRGGMATVFLARDTVEGCDVAIKVLHPELAATIGGDRFQREIRVATQLQHPHILGMRDSGVADGLMYYVMPFVAGESLRDLLEREGQLSIDEAVRITREVAAALAYAHAQGFIHRDIKPENILLQDGRALVADFGIARALTEAEKQKLTQTGMAVGTPVYMAPEQAAGDKVGPAADLYSLGCVLFEMLAGEPPFYGTNAVHILARHALEAPRSVRVVRASVPETVEAAIFSALEKSAADRPRTADEFMAILDGFVTVGLRTTTALRGSGAGVAQVPPPRSRTPLVVGGVLAAAAIAAGGLGLSQGWFAPRPVELGAEARRVAVLYFDDESRDSSLAPVADGLTEGLIDALNTVPSLTVISRGGVEPYRGTSLTADSVARALRAGFLVRGAVEPSGADVRVVLRLVDGPSGTTLDTKSFVRPAAAILGLRDSLSLVAAELLKARLGEELVLKEQRAAARDQDAWLLVQRGEQQRKRAESLIVRGDTAGFIRAFDSADSLYLAAAARDGRWVVPLVQHALVAYRRSRIVGRDLVAMRQWVDSGLVRIEAALAVAPRDPDALELRGNLRYWSWLNALDADSARRQARVDSARADFEAATRLSPKQAGAWASLAHLQGRIGSSADVLLASQKALEADEFLANADVVLGRLYTASYDLGQFDRARGWCDELVRRFPANFNATRCRLYQLTTRVEAPDIDRAWRLADSTVALAPAPRRAALRLYVNQLVGWVIARAAADRPALADSARRVILAAEGDATVDPPRDALYVGAIAAQAAGDSDLAFRFLRGYVAANRDRIASLRDDPGWQLRALSADPRYRQLLGTSP